MRTSISFAALDHLAWPDVRGLVRDAEEWGYHAVWLGEGYGWDAAVLLADLAAATTRLTLASGISNVFSRSPAQLAQLAITLDMLSGGRFQLGLGTSGPQVIEDWHGGRYENPMRRMRETIEVIRLVESGQKLSYDGRLFSMRGKVKLLARPHRPRVPIYVASLTASGIALAGELADGWLPTWVSSAHFDETLRRYLRSGAARVGRDPGAVAACVLENVFVADDPATARDLARHRIALYVGGMGTSKTNFYNRLLADYGQGEAAAAIQAAYLDRRVGAAVAAVPEEMIDLICTAGTATDCRAKIEAMSASGIDEVALRVYVPGNNAAAYRSAFASLAPRPDVPGKTVTTAGSR